MRASPSIGDGRVVGARRFNATARPNEQDTTTTYAWSGDLVDEVATDHDGDGAADVKFVYGYDDEGRLVDLAYDQPVGGGADSRTLYAYDRDGNLVRIDDDVYDDGEIDGWSRFTYDGRGNLLRSESSTSSPEVEHVVEYAYDADDRLVADLEDFDANGEPERCRTYAYDADGLLLREEDDRSPGTNLDGVDRPCDSIVDETTTYDYNADLQRISAESDDVDGTFEDERYTYDELGNVATVTHESNEEGGYSSTTRLEWTCWAAGEVSQYTSQVGTPWEFLVLHGSWPWVPVAVAE